LSRRSELRACHEQSRDLETQLAEQTAVHGRLDKERTEQESLVGQSVGAYTAAAVSLSEMRRQTASCAARLEQSTLVCSRVDEEVRLTEERIERIRAEIDSNLQK